MRTVEDRRGITWICLELPDSPVVATTGTELVTVECNSGADRVQIAVEPGWDEWDEDRLAETILAQLGKNH